MIAEKQAPRFDPRGPDLISELIAGDIENRIRAGEFGPGTRLPAGRVLAEEYGTSKVTIGRAIGVLRDRGLIRTVRPKGTFVL